MFNKVFYAALCPLIFVAIITIAFPTHSAISTVGFQEFLTFFSIPMQTKNKKDKQIRREHCLRDEMQIFEIENGPLHSIKKSIIQKDDSNFKALTFSFPALDKMSLRNEIEVYSWLPKKTGKSIAEKLNDYSLISSVELPLIDYSVIKRDTNQRIQKMEGTFYLSISGFNNKNQRQVDRGTWTATFEKLEGGWQISNVRSASGESLFSKKNPQYTELTNLQILKKIPSNLRTEAIRRGGYALAITDINNDKINDLAIGSRDEFKIFQGLSNGSYKDVTQYSGLGHLKFVKTAIFADFENRGVQDLIVTILEPTSENYNNGHSSVLFFKGSGDGKFVQKNVNFGDKRGFLQPMPAAVADFNNDGYLDLYVGYPGSKDFTVFKEQMEKNLAQGLYLNDKKGSFLDFTDTFTKDDDTFKRKFFPHGSMAVNFDQKGGVDLLVADDRNNLSPAYVNSGLNKFELKNKAKTIGIGNFGYAMSMAASDFNNDGITDLAWTNVNFHSAKRKNTACDRHWRAAGSISEDGLRLFTGLGNGNFRESSPNNLGHAWTGDGGSGVLFLDYDNDGHIDIYFTNGLWSGTSNGQDLQTVFTNMVYTTIGELLVHILNPENQAGFKDILASIKGAIQTDKMKIVESEERPSLAGYQRNRLYRNNGDGTFTEVAFFEGIDSVADGYIVGSVINKHGTPDLILRNGDPGTEDYSFAKLQYFSNSRNRTFNSLTITLEGTKSNRDAIGAFAIATIGTQKQVQHLVSNMGSVQSERALHFGMGEHEIIKNLEIHWPSGIIQKIENLKSGRLHVIEENTSTKVSQKD